MECGRIFRLPLAAPGVPHPRETRVWFAGAMLFCAQFCLVALAVAWWNAEARQEPQRPLVAARLGERVSLIASFHVISSWGR